MQYIALVADGTVTPVASVDQPTTVAIAATVGKTRLIDNILIGSQVESSAFHPGTLNPEP